MRFNSEWCVNDETKLIFITINKCAGTSLREFLPSKNFCILNNNLINDEYIVNKIIKRYKFYSVIRNPVDRYISGLSEFIHQQNIDLYNTIEDSIKNNFFIFDEHVLPQFESLKGVLKFKKDINLIKMDQNLSKKISSIINTKDTIFKINTNKNKTKSNLDFCTRMYNTYCKNNKFFENLYEKDFELYDMSM